MYYLDNVGKLATLATFLDVNDLTGNTTDNKVATRGQNWQHFSESFPRGEGARDFLYKGGYRFRCKNRVCGKIKF
jgi:hypothetical protein